MNPHCNYHNLQLNHSQHRRIWEVSGPAANVTTTAPQQKPSVLTRDNQRTTFNGNVFHTSHVEQNTGLTYFAVLHFENMHTSPPLRTYGGVGP